MRVLVCLPVLCLVSALNLGCGPKGDGHATPDSGVTERMDAGSFCERSTRMGDQVANGDLQVSITQLSPEPAEKGDNAWTLSVQTTGGTAVTGATVTVEPFMPAHGHGTSPATYDGVEVTSGHYQAGPFNLFMPGTWEVRVHVARSPMPEVVLTFTVCVTG